MYDVREIKKNDLFKIVENNSDIAIIKNNALQEQYKISTREWS